MTNTDDVKDPGQQKAASVVGAGSTTPWTRRVASTMAAHDSKLSGRIGRSMVESEEERGGGWVAKPVAKWAKKSQAMRVGPQVVWEGSEGVSRAEQAAEKL